MIWHVWCIFKRNAKHSNSEVCKYFASYFDLLWRSVADLGFATLLMTLVKNKNACYSIPRYDNLWPLASLKKNLLLKPGNYYPRSLSLKNRVIVSDRFKTATTAQGQTARFLCVYCTPLIVRRTKKTETSIHNIFQSVKKRAAFSFSLENKVNLLCNVSLNS